MLGADESGEQPVAFCIAGHMPHLPPVAAPMGIGAPVPDRRPEAEVVRLREASRRFRPTQSPLPPLPEPKGSLTPIVGSHVPGPRGWSFLFRCSCGREVRIGHYDYATGHRQSCGGDRCKRRWR